ncbi:hypothetical protein ACIQLJ_04275 [Microbacterium sp. NPDC091313]
MTSTVTRLCVAAAATLLVLSLTACGGQGTDPAVPTATASSLPPETPRPTPSPIETEAVQSPTLPTSCDTLASPSTRQEAVGDMRLQSDGERFVRPAPEGASLALGCDWIVGDSTGMLLLISTAPEAAVTAAQQALPAAGWSCQTSDDFGAQFCDLPGTGENTEEMIVAREGVWIYLSTSNRNGRAFLSEIATGIFG